MGDRNNSHISMGKPKTQPSFAPINFPPHLYGSSAGWYFASNDSITYYDPYKTTHPFSTHSTSPMSSINSLYAATGPLMTGPNSGNRSDTLNSPSAALSPSTASNISPNTTTEGLSSPGEGNTPTTREAKHHRGSLEPDYSEKVRERNKKRKRTGQACDRCRIRRFACNSNPEGCDNCSGAGLECKVTDSVTGETTVRGAAGKMIAEIQALKEQLAALMNENACLRACLP